MKTKFALAFYYLAIGFLTAVAAVIVLKLIFWPPCTQTGNTCVIDPWSAAGLEATVLGVSATVLAILGAVAVAGWWTTLHDRVNTQVKRLYEDQKEEVNARIDGLLTDQQIKVANQLAGFQASFQSLEERIGQIGADIDKIDQLAHDVEEIAVDGLMVVGADKLEEWAQKATANHRFPKVPIKMAEGYLHAIEQDIAQEEEKLRNRKNDLRTIDELYNKYSKLPNDKPQITLFNPEIQRIMGWVDFKLRRNPKESSFDWLLENCEDVLRWLAVAEGYPPAEGAGDAKILKSLREKTEVYRSEIARLEQDRYQLKEQEAELIQQTKSLSFSSLT